MLVSEYARGEAAAKCRVPFGRDGLKECAAGYLQLARTPFIGGGGDESPHAPLCIHDLVYSEPVSINRANAASRSAASG